MSLQEELQGPPPAKLVVEHDEAKGKFFVFSRSRIRGGGAGKKISKKACKPYWISSDWRKSILY